MPRTAAARSGVVRTIADEVRAFCIEKANPELVRKYAKFFREGYDAYGLDYKDPDWGRRRAEWCARLREAGAAAWLDAGDLLVKSGKYEEASFAIEFAIDMRAEYSATAFDRIARWFDGGVRNWGHTDVMSGAVLANFVLDGAVPLDGLAAWRESPHKYQRRAVPVTLVSLLKYRDDYKAMLSVIEPLMRDTEREVHQGVGWFLRELWKKKPALVERFLLKYKQTAPRLIFQYATEKMTPEQKAQFKRTK